jgi:hypothetical protein
MTTSLVSIEEPPLKTEGGLYRKKAGCEKKGVLAKPILAEGYFLVKPP